jgi:hypothetical protein
MARRTCRSFGRKRGRSDCRGAHYIVLEVIAAGSYGNIADSRIMAVPGEICWKRTFDGRNPSRVAIVGTLAACGYIDNQGQPATPGPHRLVCLDLEGRERLSVGDFQLEVALHDERLVGLNGAGELRVVDLKGRKCDGVRDGMKLVSCKDVTEVRRTHDGFLVKMKSHVLVTDPSLRVLDRFPAASRAGGLVVDGGVLYIDDGRVMRSDRKGRAELLCRIPLELVHVAMNSWENETAMPALQGVWTAKLDSRADLGFEWDLSADAELGLFVVNYMPPHLIMHLRPNGNAKWCTYLSPSCCGGAPALLSNGELVVSSGCGGIVSWLDSDGRVLRRSKPHEGVGLATALSPRIRALADSSCIVGGVSGVTAYAADGTLRWIWKEHCYSAFDYDDAFGLLVTATWIRDGDKKSVSITCIKNLGGRSATDAGSAQ